MRALLAADPGRSQACAAAPREAVEAASAGVCDAT